MFINSKKLFVMKKFQLFLLAAFMGVITTQAYVPLVREGVKWVYMFDNTIYIEGDLVGSGDFLYFYQFNGDTLINGDTYKKLYCSLSREMNTEKMCPVAFLREVDKKVYALQCKKPHHEFEGTNFYPSIEIYNNYGFWEIDDGLLDEGLIYDFGDMNVTQSLYSFWEDDDFCPKEGETTFNGQTVKTHVLSDIYLVEGVGPDGSPDRWLEGYGDFLEPLPIENFLVGTRQIKSGLVAVEDLNGNVLYKGIRHYEPGGYINFFNVDVSHVSKLIDALLGKKPIELMFDDVNADEKVDVTDVNLLIDHILGK